jgi:hypothetical protein
VRTPARIIGRLSIARAVDRRRAAVSTWKSRAFWR